MHRHALTLCASMFTTASHSTGRRRYPCCLHLIACYSMLGPRMRHTRFCDPHLVGVPSSPPWEVMRELQARAGRRMVQSKEIIPRGHALSAERGWHGGAFITSQNPPLILPPCSHHAPLYLSPCATKSSQVPPSVKSESHPLASIHMVQSRSLFHGIGRTCPISEFILTPCAGICDISS